MPSDKSSGIVAVQRSVQNAPAHSNDMALYSPEDRRVPGCPACAAIKCAKCAYTGHLHERYNMASHGMPETPLCEAHAPAPGRGLDRTPETNS